MRRKSQQRSMQSPNDDDLHNAVIESLAKIMSLAPNVLEANMTTIGGGIALDSIIASGVLSRLESRFNMRFDMKNISREDYRTPDALIRYAKRELKAQP